MHWLLIAAIIVVILYCLQREYFSSSKAPGTFSYAVVNKSNVHMLHGDNGDYAILLHSSPMNQRMWTPLFEYFQQLFVDGHKIPTLITYDIRGHGTAWEPVDPKYNDNDPHNSAWSYKQLAEDLQRVIRSQVPHGKKVILVGYGFGSGIAQQYAIDNPDRVKELVLLNGFIKPMPILQDHFQYMVDLIAQYPGLDYIPQDAYLYNGFLCEWFDVDNTAICPDNVDDKGDQSNTYMYHLAKMILSTASTQTHLQADKLLIVTDFSDQWRKAKIPYKIRIVTGSRDPSVPNNEAITGYNVIREVRPDASFTVVDAKHGFGMTNVESVAELICPKCVVKKTQ